MLLRTSPARTPLSSAALGAAALALTLSASACSGGGDEPGSEASGASSEADAGGSPSPDEATPSEDATSEEPDPTETTPPGASLDAEETAVVELADSQDSEKTLGTYGITVDGVSKEPLSKLPPDAPDPGGSDLYFVEQTYTLLDAGPGSIDGGNLLQHTMVTAGGQPVQAFISIDANPQGCDFATFTDDDAVGTEKQSCTAYLVPAGQPVEAVNYIDYRGDYDYVDGEPIAWAVDAPE